MTKITHTSKVAVIGCGYWGKNLVRNFYELGNLTAICDSSQLLLDEFKEQYEGITCAIDANAILDLPQVNAVAICTPAETHFKLVKLALEAGKDVFVEKPLCLDEAEAAELNTLAHEHKSVLMVGHLLWYHPAFLKLKTMLNEGELGQLRYVYSNRLNMGKLRREENAMWSFAPHDISMILGLVNDMPVTVVANGGNYLFPHLADVTVTTMKFAGGINAHVFVSWLNPFKEQRLVVVGEKKMAVFDDTLPWDEKLMTYAHGVSWTDQTPVAVKAQGERVALEQVEPLKQECQHFLDSIKSRSVPRTDGHEGLRVLRVLNTAQLSLDTKQAVSLTSGSRSDYFVHGSAVIDANVEIGNGTKIWHFSHILGGSTLGCNCTLGQNVVVGPRVNIGNNVKIQNNVSVYEGVVLEDDVFCGPSVVFTNVATPRSYVSRKREFKQTLVKRGATIGANATIVCGHTLGEYSFIGAGAVVTHDVQPHSLMIGNPAKQVGWMCNCGEKLAKTTDGEELVCARCKRSYIEQNRSLTEQV